MNPREPANEAGRRVKVYNLSMAHMVHCVKLGHEAEGLDETPFDSPLGQRIYDNVSKQAWQQWTEHQKMLLNEYRLQPWKKEHQEFLVQQMEAFFFGEGAEKPKDYVPPAP
jgi:Fe-S cluster biosynthesis and repair protein YggX